MSSLSTNTFSAKIKRLFKSCSKNKNKKQHKTHRNPENIYIIPRRPSLEYQAKMARTASVKSLKPELKPLHEIYEVSL